MQTVISLALALAFGKYPNLVRFSIYGHRCDTEKIEIVRFYENGEKLQWGKLFSQSALNANAGTVMLCSIALINLSLMQKTNCFL